MEETSKSASYEESMSPIGNDASISELELDFAEVLDEELQQPLLGDMDLHLECEDESQDSSNTGPQYLDPDVPQIDNSLVNGKIVKRIIFRNPPDTPETIRHYCDLCSKSFVRENLLRDHKASAHDEPDLFPCGYCTFVTQRNRCLQRHMHRKHRDKRTMVEAKSKLGKSSSSHINGIDFEENITSTLNQANKCDRVVPSNLGIVRNSSKSCFHVPIDTLVQSVKKDSNEGNACYSAVPVTMITNFSFGCDSTVCDSDSSSIDGSENSDCDYENMRTTLDSEQLLRDKTAVSLDELYVHHPRQLSFKRPTCSTETKSSIKSVSPSMKEFAAKPDQDLNLLHVNLSQTNESENDSNIKHSLEKINQRTNRMITKTCSKTFKCTFKDCDKYFRDRHNLESHKRVHTKSNIFKCSLCHYEAKQKTSLKLHLISKHTAMVDCKLDQLYACTGLG